MNQRDKLIELVEKSLASQQSNECAKCEKYECAECVGKYIADYLFKNGVIVPPCKVGDTVYVITGLNNIIPYECVGIKYGLDVGEKEKCVFYIIVPYGFEYEFGVDAFLTEKEAEKALEGMKE